MMTLVMAGCTDGGQSPGDGAVALGDGGQGGRDAAFSCADDALLEPNDSTATAFQLPSQPSVSFGPVAICPASDVDHFRTTVADQGSLDAIVQFAGAPGLAVALLNASGTAIVNGTPGSSELRASATNLPAGTYFVRVSGSVEQNYRITIAATQ